ncbi:hypothetical protein HOC76_00875 [bacterium]|nr:hypothetical protein [bacterium]
MKILFFETKKESQAFFEDKLSEHETIFFKETVQEANIKEDDLSAEVLSVFIYSQLTKDVLAKFKNYCNSINWL